MQAKKFRASVSRLALACLPALLLAACGGGGGGDDVVSGGGGGGDSGPSAGAAVSITTANAPAVAGNALATATASTGTAILTGVQVNAPSGGGASGAVLLASLARQLAAKAPAGVAAATGVTESDTETCPSGGSLTVTGSAAVAGSFSAGDSLTLVASSCNFNGPIIDGTLKVEMTAGSFSLSNLAPPVHFTMRLTATGLTVNNGSQVAALDGDETDDFSIDSGGNLTEQLSGAALTYTQTVGSTKSGFSLKNYSQTYAAGGTTASYAVSETVETINSSIGDVSYTVATGSGTPIVMEGGTYKSGSLEVTGNKSALQLTITDDDTFKLDVDTNGDGTWDSTSSKTLADL